MNKDQPTFIMLVGLPAVGKSFIRRALTFSHKVWGFSRDLTLLSTDDYIEHFAGVNNTSYDDEFQNNIKEATERMYVDLDNGVSRNNDIILDQTNLTIKSRISKLNKIPNYYHKRCLVLFNKNQEEMKKRLNDREGKTIPVHILESMTKSYAEPSITEGFDSVYFINTENNNFTITNKQGI